MKKLSIILKYGVVVFFLLSINYSIAFSQEKKSTTLYLYFADEGIYPDTSILEDPFNPYAKYSASELERVKWNHIDSGNPCEDFYVWATHLALAPGAEAQYYTAKALEKASLLEERVRNMPRKGMVFRGFGNLKKQAIRAYQVIIDYWPRAMSYDPRQNLWWSLEEGARENIYRLGEIPVIHRRTPFSLVGGKYEMRMITNNTTGYNQYDWAWHPEGVETEKWGINQYHSLGMDLGLNYGRQIEGVCGIEVYANKVAYWDTLTSREENVGVVISKVDLNLYGDWFDTWIFKNVGHYHWGDMLGFYREMYETEWAKQCNTFAPQGVEISGRGILDGITMIAGEDPIWGNSSEVFLKYEKTIELINFKLMYKDKLTDEETGRIDYVSGGGMNYYDFNPWDDQMSAFALTIGEKERFSVESEIGKFDADEKDIVLGIKSRVKLIPGQAEILAQYVNAELYAGNKKELNLEAKLMPVPWFTLEGSFTQRENIQGPTSVFPPLVLDNREGTIIKGSVIFDTTPEIPFRLWDGKFNEDENAPFALEAGYEFADYPEYTDRQKHYSYKDQVWWEETVGSQGRSPAKLDKVFARLVLNPFNRGDRIIVNFSTGLKQAEAGAVHVVEETTRFKDIELSTKIGFFRGKINCFLDDWMPYQIDGPLYGVTYDERFIVYLGRLFDREEKLKLGIEYEQVNDDDQSAEYKEYRLICSLKF